MNKGLFSFLLMGLVIGGCAGSVPYRDLGFADMPECRKLYSDYADSKKLKAGETDVTSRCWRRSKEERDQYELLFAEFDDLGWIQGTNTPTTALETRKDHLDELFGQLNGLSDEFIKKQNREIWLVVYVHGWRHNADSNDANVREFRSLLRDIHLAIGDHRGPRVVGIYVGWRGKSSYFDTLDFPTFWDRKNTAERVAQGSVRELFEKLDNFRDRGVVKKERKVRMLTIGHSFGGLVTFESLSSEFLRSAARHPDGEGLGTGSGKYLSRMGDLVVIANPAFEGARYEPLRVAGLRLTELDSKQLPVVITATSTADWATRYAFPFARYFSTFFESDPDDQKDANRLTVGHNDRYVTHELAACPKDDVACTSACKRAIPLEQTVTSEADRAGHLRDELNFAAQSLLSGIERKQPLCDGLMLTATPNWTPQANPFWVVRTTGDIIEDHNDIFNPRFVAFVRQMFLAVIASRDSRSRVAKE